FGPERVLSDLDQFAKRGAVLRGEVREHFAVERDLRGLQSFHETAVGEAGSAGSGVGADLPKRSEIALLGLAIPIGVLASVIDRIGSVTVEFGTAHPKALARPDHSGASVALGRGG